MPRKLTRAFFNRPTLTVARELIGKLIVDKRSASDGPRFFRIVEVEAYIGEKDPACHAACGPTPRNQIMYGPPGYAYIYFIYGMYHCLNVVTERRGFPAAVLIRAVEPLNSRLRISSQISSKSSPSGPGKLCRVIGLTRTATGLDLTGSEIYFASVAGVQAKVARSPRIGIRVGTDRLWRFFDPASSFVSGRRSARNLPVKKARPARS